MLSQARSRSFQKAEDEMSRLNFHYKDVVPWGRSFDEYLGMFNLSADDLARDIVGVGDGPASFNFWMHQRGTPIVSVDPIYRYAESELHQRIQETYDDVIAQAHQNRDKFVWTHISSVDELAEIRMQAMEAFCGDFETGKRQGRYIDASLPNLPFPDGRFDLVLSAHLLFSTPPIEIWYSISMRFGNYFGSELR